MRVMRPGPVDRVLDVGAGLGQGRALNFFEHWYPWRRNITAVALEDLPELRSACPEIKVVVADGRGLPFSDRSFDIYFSNAVLEHVGTYRDQESFVHEACRVAEKAFISTPNRWFPLDSHTLIPFAHWLPLKARNFLYRILGRGYYADERRLRLVGLRELRRMVPAGKRLEAYPQKICGLTANWNIVIGGNPPAATSKNRPERRTG